MAIEIHAYLLPTLVLLALNWDEAKSRDDFLGFAIRRSPGFWSANGKTRASESWLPNRLTFKGPVQSDQPDAPSNTAPIQKFMWWDARIDEPDREKPFTYTAYPVVVSRTRRSCWNRRRRRSGSCCLCISKIASARGSIARS